MARAGTRRKTQDDGGDGGDGGIDPGAILSGWWEAGRIAAGTLMAPVFALTGAKAPAAPRGALARAARGFPLVGLVIGLIAALVYAIADGLHLPAVISAVFAVSIMTALGGGLTESGCARFAEALFGGHPKGERLKVMKEGPLGTCGIIALVMAFALRVTCLAAIAAPVAVVGALCAAATASRGVMPALLYYLTPARRSGLAYRAGTPAFDQMVLAAALGAAVALFFLGPWHGVIALAVGAAGAFLFAWLARRYVGGITGAGLGAAQQSAEIGVLLAIVALR